MKKNYGMFKIVFFILLGAMVLTWIIPASNYTGEGLEVGEISRMDILSLINYPISAFEYFLNPAVFLLVVGSFYGILNQTGAYKNLLEKISKKVKGKEKLFLSLVIVMFAALTSLCGLGLELFVFIPLIISIILMLGYDKVTALASTIGASIVGIFGSTFGTYGAGYVNQSLQLDFSLQLITKFILLALGIAGLIFFVVKYNDKAAKKTKAKAAKETKESNDDPLLLEDAKADKKKGSKTIFIVFCVILVFMILGYVPWSTLNITAFEDFHAWFTGLKIGNFEIVNAILGSSKAFGNWYLQEIVMLLFAAEIVLWIVYKIKFTDLMSAAFEGAKRILPVAAIVIFVYTIAVVTVTHPFYFTVVKWLAGLFKGFNIITATLISLLGSFLYVDIAYFVGNPFLLMTMVIDNAKMNGAYTILAQGIASVVMLIGPTSVLLCAGLTYLDVSYKNWVKYIWKFALALFVVALIAIAIIIVL